MSLTKQMRKMRCLATRKGSRDGDYRFFVYASK